MEITEYAKTSKIPLDILKKMVKRKFISNPLIDENLRCLQFSENLWMWREYLRAQMVKLNQKQRKTFIETCNLKTRWERDAYSRMSNLIQAGEDIEIEKMIRLLEWSFQFQMSPFQRQTIYRMRKSLLRKHERMIQKELEEQKNEDDLYVQMFKNISSQTQ